MATKNYIKTVKTGRWKNSPNAKWEAKAKASYAKITSRSIKI